MAPRPVRRPSFPGAVYSTIAAVCRMCVETLRPSRHHGLRNANGGTLAAAIDGSMNMHAQVEAAFFGIIAILVAAQILAGFASLAYPQAAGADAGRQMQVRGVTTCPAPAGARVQAALASQTSGA